MEGPEIKAAEAVIDNGSFGKRTLRFETGRLAQQADGAVAAYLDDDTMILSTTTAGSSPKENYDFFPLTVDVEEKMYAAGKIPGSFFRREGRPSSEAILACRIIDRPLRPLFPLRASSRSSAARACAFFFFFSRLSISRFASAMSGSRFAAAFVARSAAATAHASSSKPSMRTSGISRFVNFSMSASASCVSGVTKEIARPFAPARPVRPMRCT